MYRAGIIEPREWKHCDKLNPFLLRDSVLYLYIDMMNHQKSSTWKPKKKSRGPPLQTRPNPDFLMASQNSGEIWWNIRWWPWNLHQLKRFVVYLPASCADGSLQTHGRNLAKKKVEIFKKVNLSLKKLGRLSPQKFSTALRIIGSRNWWFGDPKPGYTHPNPSIGGFNDS